MRFFAGTVGPPASLAVSCFREPRQGRFTPLRCVPRRLRRWPCGPPLTRPAPARGEASGRPGGWGPRWGGVRSAGWLAGLGARRRVRARRVGSAADLRWVVGAASVRPVGGRRGCQRRGGGVPWVSTAGAVPWVSTPGAVPWVSTAGAVGWVPPVSGRGLGSVALPVRLARAAPADRSALRRPGHRSASRGECRCVLREQCRVLRGGEF